MIQVTDFSHSGQCNFKFDFQFTKDGEIYVCVGGGDAWQNPVCKGWCNVWKGAELQNSSLPIDGERPKNPGGIVTCSIQY